MKTRIFLAAILALAFAGTGTTFGTVHSRSIFIQNPQFQQMSPEDRAKSETASMKTDLGLTDQQVAKVDSINLKYAKKRAEMRGQFQNDRQAMMSKMQEMQEQKNAELKPVLTEAQMKKYLELLQQRRSNRMGQGRGPQSQN